MTLSPLTAAVAELAADAAVRAIVGVDATGIYRVRPVEPLGTVGTVPGDARGPGAYIPFVVVSVLDAPWQAGTATSVVTLGLKTYGATFAAAEALALACAATFHRKGGRVATSRLGIYSSLTQGGPQLDKDPDTSQPLAHLIVVLNTSIQPIPA
mgnify:FL=1